MKLKDLKTDSENLFDKIDYFKALGDPTPYYQEFIFLYGERELISKVETDFTENGLTNIGGLFTLKTSKWNDFKLIDDKIKDIETTDRKVVNTGTQLNTGDKTRKSNTSNVNEVTPFDISDSIENEQNSNNLDESENSKDNSTTENTTLYTGFSKDKIDYFLNRFKNYEEYRRLIYIDIINVLTLQVY